MPEPESPPASAPESASEGPARSWCTRLALAAGGVAALWLVFEVVARVVPIPGLRMADLDPVAVQLEQAFVQPHPYLAYSLKPGFEKEAGPEGGQQVSHNSLGFRGPEITWEKPPGVRRVLCIGGSSTYGFGPSSDATTWPARLEQHLEEALPEVPFEVVNLGCQGWSTHESLINLALRGIDLAPDLIVVYHSINDVRCALYPGVRHDNTHWRALWPSSRKVPSEKWLEKSRLYLTLRRYGSSWFANRQNLGSYVIVDFGKYAPDDYNQPGDVDLGFRNFQRNLVNIVELGHAHGAEVLLMTQGCDVSDFSEALSSEMQVAGLQRAREVILAVARDRKAPWYDGQAELERVAAEQIAADGDERIFTHEVHLSDEGAEVLARGLAAKLVAEGYFR